MGDKAQDSITPCHPRNMHLLQERGWRQPGPTLLLSLGSHWIGVVAHSVKLLDFWRSFSFFFFFKLMKGFLHLCVFYTSPRSLFSAGIQVPIWPRRINAPNTLIVQAKLGLQFTAAVRLVLLSSGSEHWAIWRPGGATHEFLLTDRSVVVPGCRCTASGGCRRCRQPLLQ